MLLAGKKGIVFGVANQRSIAWAIAKRAVEEGAHLALTFQNERLEPNVRELAFSLKDPIVLPCDVTNDEELASVFQTLRAEFETLDFIVHAVAYADKTELEGEFINTTREGYRIAQEVSSYSLTAVCRHALPLMEGR